MSASRRLEWSTSTRYGRSEAGVASAGVTVASVRTTRSSQRAGCRREKDIERPQMPATAELDAASCADIALGKTTDVLRIQGLRHLCHWQFTQVGVGKAEAAVALRTDATG